MTEILDSSFLFTNVLSLIYPPNYTIEVKQPTCTIEGNWSKFVAKHSGFTCSKWKSNIPIKICRVGLGPFIYHFKSINSHKYTPPLTPTKKNIERKYLQWI